MGAGGVSSERLLELLFDDGDAGRCLWAAGGEVLRWNGEWLRWSGLSTAEAGDAELAALLAGACGSAAGPLLARARAGERMELPRHDRREGGRVSAWEGSLTPVEAQEGMGLLLTVREVPRAEGRDLGLLTGAGDDRRRVEEELRMLAAVVQSSNDFIGLCTPDLRPFFVNAAGRRMVGLGERDVRETHVLDYFAPEERPRIQAEAIPALVRDGRWGGEVRFRHFETGEPIHTLWSAFVIRGADGAPLAWATISPDLAGMKRAEGELRASEERLRRTLRFASAGTFERSLTSPALRWSEETYGLYGLDPSEPIDVERWERLVHPEDLPGVRAAVRAAAEGREPEYRAEFRVHHPARGVRWLSGVGRIERGPDGAPLRLMGLTVDVTDRRLAEEALREAYRRQREFLAVLSHELRNPLAPIRNGIAVLDRAAPGSEAAARAAESIRRQAAHLTRLVDDLLDVTRISHGKIELQPERIDLRDVVRKSADDLRAAFSQAGVELRVEHGPGPIWLEADPVRVSQIVGNLLHNAVKFTPRGGAVAVSAAAREGRASLRVRDDGVGMEPGVVDAMFEPFAQADHGLARTQGGLGLGLALVKGLVELHGGTVSARSEGPGRGAEFLVDLPLAAGLEAPATAGAGARAALGVVVIEDNVDAGQTLADLLELEGHRVRVATSGRAGLALVREVRPDVVLCDLGLPDLDGFEVARAVRADEAIRAVRLVALSGYARPEDRRRALEAGFDVHVAKPPELDALLDALTGGGPG